MGAETCGAGKRDQRCFRLAQEIECPAPQPRLNDVRPCYARSAPDSSSIWDAKGNVRQPWREARAKQEEMCMQPGSSRRLRVFAATTLILGLPLAGKCQSYDADLVQSVRDAPVRSRPATNSEALFTAAKGTTLV